MSSPALRMPEVPVLVGRSSELDALIDAVLHPPAVVLIEGEAGIGKTRLIHEAVRNPAIRVRPGDRPEHSVRRILLGSCHRLREPFPYGPVFDLLRQLPDHAEDVVGPDTALNPVCGALRPYLPELAGLLPPPPEPLHDPRASRHRLFRAVRALLASIGPTVMVVEDLHWADDGTRDLLRFLVADPPPELATVLSYRREDLSAPGLPLGNAYRSRPDVTSVLIPLYPLALPEVRCLCAGIRGTGEVVRELAVEVHRRTAGIPFVVEEVVRALPESAAGTEEDHDLAALTEMAVPALLQEASAEQMGRLSPAAVAAVRAASVLQMPSEEDVIAAVMQAPSVDTDVADADRSDPAAAIGEALQAHVLYEWDDRYGFRHTLAQQAVYQSLPSQDRRRLHRQVVDVLARREPKPLRHLAYHARMAGRSTLWRQYAEAAAASAREMGDVALAVEVLEELLSDGRLGRQDRARIAVELSRDAVVGLSRTRVTGLLRTIVNDAQLPDGIRGEIRLNLGLLLSNQQGRYSEGRIDTELAVEELRDRPELAARGMAALAMPSWGDHPHHVYQRWIELAEEQLDRSSDPGVATAVRANRLSLMMSAGDPDVWGQVDAMVEGAGRGPIEATDGDARQIARACCNFADTATVTGHYAQARRLRGIGRRLAAECGASFFEGLVEGTSLRLDWYAGAWKGLADRAQDTLDVVQGMSGIAADAHLVLGLLASAAGEWDTAATELNASGLADPANAPAPILAAAGGAMIRLLLARGDVEAARAEAERGLARIRRKAIWAWSGDLAPMAVRALVNAGAIEQAEDVVEELATGIADRDAPLAAAALRACAGIVAIARDRHADAVAAFGVAQSRYLDLDQPYMAARTEEAIYRCRLRTRDDEATQGLLLLADRFTELGAVRDAARCRQALRSNSVNPPSRRGRRGYGDELSPREREVARMVAIGHTNREIADVLYLSPRTVEQHVARVLRKLNVGSRGEVSVTDNDSLIPTAS